MHAQEINELLARGEADSSGEAGRADAYLLLNKGDMPSWLEDFLESNRRKLMETICRAAAVRRGVSSIEGYREGYFNEIVQNANDLHCGETMEIQVYRSDESRGLACRYADRGFSLSNIYAFLNREMSDKLEDPAQTGTFGVGVKSLFKFVDSLRIRSNVRFSFRIDRDAGNAVSGSVAVDPEWNGKQTVLELTYHPATETAFNTAKLTALIDALCTPGPIGAAPFFLTGRDNELVFDLRSLLFMKLRSGRKPGLTRLVFSGSAHSVELRCEEVDKECAVRQNETLWRTGTLRLAMDLDGENVCEKRCVYFSNGLFSAALPLDGHAEDKNRLYATYYLKTDEKDRLYPAGLLFDTQSANMHRADVGDSEASIDRVYGELRAGMGELFSLMCAPEAAALPFAAAISEAFHTLVARYLPADWKRFPESPLNGPYSNGFLPKTRGGLVRPYVVRRREREEYDSASFQEGDIVRELRESYFEFVEKGGVCGLSELLSPDCIPGVRNAYALLAESPEIPEENRERANELLNYFPSVRAFLAFSVSGRRGADSVTDAEADAWLEALREPAGRYFNEAVFLKLLGRYRLNPAIAWDGSILQSNLSFRDYLFSGLRTGSGILAQRQNAQFEKTFGALKRGLLRERYTDPGNPEDPYQIRCIRPVSSSVSGWDGAYDETLLQEPRESVPVEDLDLLLEKLAEDPSLSGQVLEGDPPKLFEKTARKMRKRKDGFKYWTVEYQQIIRLSCLGEIRLEQFSKFVRAVKHRSMLSPGLREFVHIRCVEKRVSTADVTRAILPAFMETERPLLEEYQAADVEIGQVEDGGGNELSPEYVEFIRRATGYRVHAYRFPSGGRRKLTAYFGNGRFAVRTGQAYQEAARYRSEEKDVFIFSSGSGDLQSLVVEVLEDFGLGAKRLELIGGYIHSVGSAGSLDDLTRRREAFRGRELRLDWAEAAPEDLGEVSDPVILYRLLTARGSYDQFCPLCGEVPAEGFGYREDAKKSSGRKLILLENESPDTREAMPFILTTACRYCRERLRSTLLRAEFDGAALLLTTQAAYGTHERTMTRQRVPLSPVNLELMRKFRL